MAFTKWHARMSVVRVKNKTSQSATLFRQAVWPQTFQSKRADLSGLHSELMLFTSSRPVSTSAKDFVNSQFGLPSPQDSPNAARVVAGSMRNDESDPATDTAISSVAISG